MAPPASEFVEAFALVPVLAGPMPAGLAIARRALAGADKYPVTFQTGVLLTTWCVLQCAIAIALGSVGLLRLQPVLTAEMLVAALGTAWLLRPVPTTASAPAKPAAPLSAPEIITFTLLALTAALLTWQVVTVPVTDYDSLMYHLPATAGFYRTGTLQIPEQFRENPIGYYPYSWEAASTLPCLPFREDVFVLLPGLVAVALFAIFVFLLATESGAERGTALMVAAIALTYPITIHTVGTAHVDLPLATFFLAALFFGKVYARTLNPWDLLLAAAAGGMMPGIKTSGLIYAGLAVAAGAWFRLSTPRSERIAAGPPGVASAFLAVAVGLVASGWWYWYVRNWIVAGNPLGLLSVRVAGITVFPGSLDVAEVRQTTLAHLFTLSDAAHVKVLARAVVRELGLAFVVLACAVPLGCVRILLKPRLLNREVVFGTSLAAVTLLVYWLTPYSADNGSHGWQITNWIGQAIRYAFPFLGVLAVLVAVAGAAAPLPASLLTGLLLVNCSLFLLQETEFLYLCGGCLAVCGIVSGASPTRTVPIRSGWIVATAAAGGFAALLVLSPMLRTKREVQRVDKYAGLVRFIDDNTRPGEPVGYFGSHKAYLFFGRHLDRAATYCPPGESTDLDTWSTTLRKQGIKLVALGPLAHGLDCERALAWIAKHPHRLAPVFGKDPQIETVVYRLAD